MRFLAICTNEDLRSPASAQIAARNWVRKCKRACMQLRGSWMLCAGSSWIFDLRSVEQDVNQGPNKSLSIQLTYALMLR